MTVSNLPRIACFHGGGSAAAIYKVQCEQLGHLLKNDFQLVFFEGPFERSAGPGVLPVFADYAPFKSWFTQDERGERADGSGYDASGNDGVERVWRLMEDEGPGGEWVGAMGFSQGSRVAGGLLLDQQRRDALGIPKKTHIELLFGVLCNGAGSPMESDAAECMVLFLCFGVVCAYRVRYHEAG
jgi:predicted esterase